MNISKYVLLCALAVGCAHKAPTELVDARAAYQRASTSPAATVNPADLHIAEVALQTAETAYKDDPKGYRTKDLAYVAERKAQLAETLANTQLAAQAKAKSNEQFTVAQGEALTSTKDQLAAAQSSAAVNAEKMTAVSDKLTVASDKLTVAEQQLKDAEQKRDAALAELAATKEEARGLVITLSGSVLFASDKSELLPEAQTRLGQVTEALMTTKKRSLVIEGHTDSQGDDAHNLQLSQRRAEAVRSYLISRGYDQSLIQARGIGETRPIASNDGAEGRANNRRVEIIVDRGSAAAK